MDTNMPNASATGTANHTPSSPTICGKSKIIATKNKKVLVKEIIADAFPSESAVNNAETKMFMPIKIKARE